MNGYQGSGGSIACNGGVVVDACFGFTGTVSGGSVGLSNTEADAQPQQGNPPNELIYLNDLLTLLPAATVLDVFKTDGAGSGFTTNKEYFSLKKATDLFYFKNTSGITDCCAKWG